MKKIAIVVGLLAIVAIFVFHTFNSTGYFREIEVSSVSMIAGKIVLPGVEDIAISYDGQFMIFSSDDRAARRDAQKLGQKSPTQGGLYLVDLSKLGYEPVLLTDGIGREFNPHGISLLQIDTATYKIWAINHVDGKHTIETFLLYGDSLVEDRIITSEALISPNDITAASEHTFYVTNDHGTTSKLGRLMEDYLGFAKANVVYYDGGVFRQVADGLAYANGINVDTKQGILYVAASRSFTVHAYTVGDSGDLAHMRDIKAGTGVDNIEIDPQGDLWIGCHPNLLWFASYAAGKKEISPSEVIRIRTANKDYAVESLYAELGENVSAASVAIPYGGKVFIGNVMDKHVLVIDLDEAGQ